MDECMKATRKESKRKEKILETIHITYPERRRLGVKTPEQAKADQLRFISVLLMLSFWFPSFHDIIIVSGTKTQKGNCFWMK